MVWCVGVGYGDASLVAGSRAPQHTYEEGLYTASWRGVRGSQWVRIVECPVCREVAEVRRGQAGNLPKVFGLLR